MANRKDGTPRAQRKDWEPVELMMERLSMPEPNTGCFIWLGKLGTHGYANIAYREDGKRHFRKAATVAYELANGPVPEGLEVSHICPGGGNVWCVNPDHLIVETHAENLARRRPFDRRTYGGLCKNGHVLPPPEQRASNNSCPICRAEYLKKWRAEHADHLKAYFRKRNPRSVME